MTESAASGAAHSTRSLDTHLLARFCTLRLNLAAARHRLYMYLLDPTLDPLPADQVIRLVWELLRDGETDLSCPHCGRPVTAETRAA